MRSICPACDKPLTTTQLRSQHVQPRKEATAKRLRDFADMLRRHKADATGEHQEPLLVFEFRHSSWFCQQVRDFEQKGPDARL